MAAAQAVVIIINKILWFFSPAIGIITGNAGMTNLDKAPVIDGNRHVQSLWNMTAPKLYYYDFHCFRWKHNGGTDRQMDRLMDGQTDPLKKMGGRLSVLNLVYHFSILIIQSYIRFIAFKFKGCSWRPFPAHPRCADWHYNEIDEFASSRAFN